MSDEVSNWKDSIPWLLVIIGWGFTHVFSEARERRKEIRAQIDKVYEQIYKLEDDARAFHCAEKFDAAKAGALMSKIMILEKSLGRITILKDAELDSEIVAFRRAVTLNNFDRSTFSSQGQDSSILREIYDTNADLEDKIERQYWGRYIPNFPYFNFNIISAARSKLMILRKKY